MSGPGLKVGLGDPRLPALRAIRPPAFLMLCVGILNIVFCVGVMVWLAMGNRLPEEMSQGQVVKYQPVTWQLVTTIAGGVVSGALTVWGALSAVSLKNWGLAALGALATLLPLSPVCCFGALVCPWMIWVLNAPEVKQHFQGQEKR